MAPAEDNYDIVVIGGGPAGCAAARAARRRALRVLIVEQHARPQPRSCPGWLGPAAIEVCQGWGVDVAAVGSAFRGVRLWSWELRQQVEVDGAELVGCIVDPAALSGALLKAARTAGAALHRPGTVEGLHLGEDRATLRLSDGRTVTGQFVLIADGADSTVAALAHLATARQVVVREGCAAAVFPTPAADPRLDIVLGGGGGLRLITVARAVDATRVMLLTREAARPATAQLQEWAATAQQAGLLPPGPVPLPISLPCLAGTALEMESHVSKRSLLIGDAGGFVASFSNEGIYPALRSGWLAAQTAADALAAPIPQDELAFFSTRWREDLAEYLRMPNTDLGLLLPMVFKNPRMSRRLARAFLLGQAF